MSNAESNPVKRQYTRKEVNTGEMAITQKADIDMTDSIVHGESLPNVEGQEILLQEYNGPLPMDVPKEKFNDPEYMKALPKFMAELAFMEEPVTIRIEENSRSDFPETHVPAQVSGSGAEVLVEGHWVRMTYLPIGMEIVTKRKYVEVLARAKTDTIKTQHDDATVERPRNITQRRTSANYPLTIISDTPRGHAWMSGIMRGH